MLRLSGSHGRWSGCSCANTLCVLGPRSGSRAGFVAPRDPTVRGRSAEEGNSARRHVLRPDVVGWSRLYLPRYARAIGSTSRSWICITQQMFGWRSTSIARTEPSVPARDVVSSRLGQSANS